MIERVGKEGYMDPPSLRFGGQARNPAMKYFVEFLLGRIFCGEPVPTLPENALGCRAVDARGHHNGSGYCEVGILILEMAIANPGQAIANANKFAVP